MQVLPAQVVLLAEELEPVRPALLRLALLRLLQRGEDRGPAEEVDDDEQRQQQEPRVVLVDGTRAAAAAAPTCHHVALVSAAPSQRETCGMVVCAKKPPKKRTVLRRNVKMYSHKEGGKSCAVQSQSARNSGVESFHGCGFDSFARAHLHDPTGSSQTRVSSPPPSVYTLGSGVAKTLGGGGEIRAANLWMQGVVPLRSGDPASPKEVSTPERAFYAIASVNLQCRSSKFNSACEVDVAQSVHS